MRIYISLLLFICSLNIFATKLPPAPQPEALQNAVNAFIEAHNNDEKITRLSYWNGYESNPLSHFLSIPFCCDSSDDIFNAVLTAFVADEKNCYQYVHETPGTGLLYSVSFGERRHVTRQSKNQEFYMLCAKNPVNPRFRDMYAISFIRKKNGNEQSYEGTLFRIYSPRPDYKEEDAEEMPNWQDFILVGQFDKELSNSCKYVWFKGVRNKGGVDISRWRENVIDGRFVYKDKAYKSTEFQISYVYKNGETSEWQTVKVSPSTTIYATFHKNGYDIDRVEKEYADDEKAVDKQKMAKTEETLKAYSTTLKTINDQIRELRSVPEDAPDYADVKKRLSTLHKSAKDITNKMQELVEKVAKELE